MLGFKPPHPAFSTLLPLAITAEAAIRSVRQAQAEGLARVDVEQLEKVLPQLVSGPPGTGPGPGTGGWPTPIGSERASPPQLLDF